MRHLFIYAIALLLSLCNAVPAQQNSPNERNGDTDPCSRFKMQIKVPPDAVDFKLHVVKPSEDVEYKLRVINPCPAEIPQFAFVLPVEPQQEKGSFLAPKSYRFEIAPKEDEKRKESDTLKFRNPLLPMLKQK